MVLPCSKRTLIDQTQISQAMSTLLLLEISINYALRDQDRTIIDLDTLGTNPIPDFVRVPTKTIVTGVIARSGIPYRIDTTDSRYLVVQQNLTIDQVQSLADQTRARFGYLPIIARHEEDRRRQLQYDDSDGSEPEPT